MSGIAGIARPGRVAEVTSMLEALAHRGRAGLNVFEAEDSCLGAVSATGKLQAWDASGVMVRDETGPGHFARAVAHNGGFVLSRDPIGVAPLYYGHAPDGALCFASEVKALLTVSEQVHELPPGYPVTMGSTSRSRHPSRLNHSAPNLQSSWRRCCGKGCKPLWHVV